MKLRDLESTDRRIGLVTAAVGAVLMLGLTLSGIWLFLFHDPDWDTYVAGDDRPLANDPTGMADMHQTLGDLTAIVVLWTTAWLSYRVFARIVKTGLVVLAVVVAGILTGKIIRVNAVMRNGVADPTARGYADVLRGDYDFLVTGRSDLEPLAAALWTLAHLATLPLALMLVWFVYQRSQSRARNTPAPDPSWLDHLR